MHAAYPPCSFHGAVWRPLSRPSRCGSGQTIIVDDIHGIVVGNAAVGHLVAGEPGGVAVVATAGPKRVHNGEVEMGAIVAVAAIAGAACHGDLGPLADGLILADLQTAQMCVE